MKSKHYLHGGDLDAVAQIYNLDRNKILDFSGNINPLGTSPNARYMIASHIDLISTYPDRSYTSLRHTLSAYCQTDPSHIIVGNGTSELISLIIHLLNPKRALTLAPTYSEYEREIQMLGGTLDYYILDAKENFTLTLSSLCEKLTQEIDLFVLCNPNNPTSTALTTQDLYTLLTHCKANNIFMMVDETYIEFCDNPLDFSAISLTDAFDNLLVLRGISKFFSAPGLRFGYGICSNTHLLSKFKEAQNPWSVNMLATIGAEAMFQDKAYITSTHSLFITERKRIVKELSTWKHIHIFPPQANFVLLKLIDIPLTGNEIASILIQKNILIRDASSFPSLDETYIRFCFLAPHQNDILLKELKLLIEEYA